MFISVPLYVGLRYLRAKRRNQFISFVSTFSLLGMAFGVMALIAVMSVMNGFDKELKQRILSVTPHILVQAPTDSDWQLVAANVKGTQGVVSSAPYIHTSALISYQSGMQGVEVQGVLPELEQYVSVVDQHMRMGKLSDLKAGAYNVIVGRLLARNLGVMPGDKLLLTLPQVQVTPAGLFPRVKRFTVSGVFEVGAQADQNLAIIHMRDAQKILRMAQKADGLRIKTSDIYRAGSIASELDLALGANYQAIDWSQTQGSLFQAVKMEKMVIGILLMIVVAVAAFNIISSLILMVADKRSDIAVLRTMGMTAAQVMAVFMVQGLAVGLLGILIGAISGCLLGLFIGDLVTWFEVLTGRYIFDPSIYFISQLPSDLQSTDVVIVCATATVLSLLATIYPAWRATRIQPADALRYE
tara:strand:- start:3537 stop:4775 length:1239 start_codon:yes stop_codon:yes gene_type:complete